MQCAKTQPDRQSPAHSGVFTHCQLSQLPTGMQAFCRVCHTCSPINQPAPLAYPCSIRYAEPSVLASLQISRGSLCTRSVEERSPEVHQEEQA